MTPDKQALLRMLGLARRAGRLAVGNDAVTKMVAKGKSPPVIIATDVSPKQRERIMRLQPVRTFWTDKLDRDELASALGRKELVVAALDDPDFLRGLGLGSGRKRSGRPRQNHEPRKGQ
ncbi:ribosomal L7Ae/L30e/S12e/Gadd45 family protein [bacterium]|nr:ribosomal L7Ae/L30e/S12e/Gadd45 family protein [bacterium]